MINALMFRLPSNSSSHSIKLKVEHMQICIDIDCTAIRTLHKLIDNYWHYQFKTVVIP